MSNIFVIIYTYIKHNNLVFSAEQRRESFESSSTNWGNRLEEIALLGG